MNERFITHSVEETEREAARIAREAAPGTVFLLEGDLGAGKTAFARGFAAALGVTEPVSSPTFTIVQEYILPGKKMLFHMDLYRITDADAALAFGIDEFLDDPNAWCLIEWPERGDGLYPEDRIVQIRIDRDPSEPETRTFTVTGPDRK